MIKKYMYVSFFIVSCLQQKKESSVKDTGVISATVYHSDTLISQLCDTSRNEISLIGVCSKRYEYYHTQKKDTAGTVVEDTYCKRLGSGENETNRVGYKITRVSNSLDFVEDCGKWISLGTAQKMYGLDANKLNLGTHKLEKRAGTSLVETGYRNIEKGCEGLGDIFKIAWGTRSRQITSYLKQQKLVAKLKSLIAYKSGLVTGFENLKKDCPEYTTEIDGYMQQLR